MILNRGDKAALKHSDRVFEVESRNVNDINIKFLDRPNWLAQEFKTSDIEENSRSLTDTEKSRFPDAVVSVGTVALNISEEDEDDEFCYLQDYQGAKHLKTLITNLSTYIFDNNENICRLKYYAPYAPIYRLSLDL